MKDLKRRLIELAEKEHAKRKPLRGRPQDEADRTAVKEVAGWRRHWRDHLKRHWPEYTAHRKDHPEWLQAASMAASVFNTPDLTANNPFHVPMWCGIVDDQYIDQWRRHWSATPVRRRILQEALEREKEIKKARRSKGRVSYLDRYWIYLFNQRRCKICGRFVSRKGFHLDHRQPLSWGGEHTLDNVQIACPRCNLKKGPRPRKNFWNWYRQTKETQ